MNWWLAPPPPPSAAARVGAQARQARLTKPPGSLGRLESLALDFAAWQDSEQPRLDRVQVCVFAADHGVVAEGVSAFPQAVTVQMIANFAAGGAAITVLARAAGAAFAVVNIGAAAPVPDMPSLRNRPVAAGTMNFCTGPAMSRAQLVQALDTGRSEVDREADLLVGGEMGIGNTTAAAALASALLDLAPADTVGRGTGVDDAGLAHKREVVQRALDRHRPHCDSPAETLRRLGGFEIAGLVGAYIGAAQAGIPSLVDGYICTAAALVACRLNPPVRDWLLFSHCSVEPGHRYLLEAMAARPLVDLDLRLGEGSGAAAVVPLLQSACALHSQMATFDEAGVSDGGAEP